MTLGQARGFTFFELIVAVLLLTLVTTMIGSVLRVSINFTDKGEKRIFALEREQSFLELLQRQVVGARYDSRRRQVEISADGDLLRLVTRSPLLYRQAGIVLAMYRYDPSTQALYYTEKRDFYNIDYQDDYWPDFDEMIFLLQVEEPPEFSFDEETLAVLFSYAGREYEFLPRSTANPEQL